MANHKSAIKRARQNKVRRLRNKSYMTRVKNAIKKVRADIENRSDTARESLNTAISVIQRSVSKGVIHKNKGARLVSRLARQVNRITS